MNKFSLALFAIHVSICLVFSFALLPMVMEKWGVRITQDEYDDLAVNLASGQGFRGEHGEESVIRGPGYPAFLAAIYSVFGHSYAWVQVFQSLLSGVNILLAYLLVREMTSELPARLALVIMAFNPFTIWYTGRIMVETLFFTTCLLVFISTWKLLKERSVFWSVMAGASLAATAYIKSLALVFIAPILLLLLLKEKKVVSTLKHGGIALLIMILLILPWTYRNYVVTDGEFIPVHASLALPLTQSYLYMEYFAESPLSTRMAFQATNEKLKEITAAAGYEPFHYPLHSLNSELRIENAAKTYFSELYLQNPLLYSGHFLLRLLLFWYYSSNPIFSIVWMLYNGLLIALFLAGLGRVKRETMSFSIVWILFFMGIHALIIASARFSLPLHPLVLAAACPLLILKLPWIPRLLAKKDVNSGSPAD